MFSEKLKHFIPAFKLKITFSDSNKEYTLGCVVFRVIYAYTMQTRYLHNIAITERISN